MSGHSKWANTKHRKNLQDSKKSKIFEKIIRKIISAVRIGGIDVNHNSKLRSIIDKALLKNMSRTTINNAIYRLNNIKNDNSKKNIIYEGYGPGRVALIIECYNLNNKNRIVSEIRYLFNKYKGNLSSIGSVLYLFKKQGIFYFKNDIIKINDIINLSIDAGADDINIKNNLVAIYISYEKLKILKNKYDKLNFLYSKINIKYIPKNYININKKNNDLLIKLIKKLKSCNYVKNIFNNKN